MRVSHFAVRHPVYIAMALITLLLFGIVSVTSMNTEFIGDMNIPQVYVIAIYPGASPEEIEKDVIKILEEDFVTLPNFSSMTSTAQESAAIVIVKYADGVDVYDQLDEIRNRIDQLEDDLPAGLSGTPQALVGGTEMLDVFKFVVEGDEDVVGLTSYVNDELVPLITRIEGVSVVEVTGGYESKVIVKLKTDELNARGISPLQVYQVLSYSNLTIPLSQTTHQGKNASIMFDGAFEDLEDIRNLTVGASSDGKLVKLSDVAEVSLTEPEQDIKVKKDGKNAIAIGIRKRSDGNTLLITNAVKKILEEQEAKKGGAVRFGLLSDDSRTINASFRSVISSGLTGIVIAMLVIFLCLGDPQATLTIAISMPLSIFFAFIGMRITGTSINLLSLSGIVIALGSIVDGSIVMLDQSYKNYRIKKNGKYLYTVNQSLDLASNSVGNSILGSALTTIVVFIPILFMQGLVGQILRDLSISFMFALAGSALVAIIVIPFILKLLLKEERKEIKDNIFTRFMARLTGLYKRGVSWALSNRKFLLLLSLIMLALTFWCVMQLGMTFIPSTDNSEFYVDVEFPTTYTLDMTEKAMERVERLVLETIGDYSTYCVYIGAGSSMNFNAQSNIASMQVELLPVAERDEDIHDIILRMQRTLDSNIPDATIKVSNGGFDNLISYVTGGGGYGLTLLGTDNELLYQEASRIKEFIEEDPEVTVASMDTSYDTYTTTIKASNDYLASLGITSYEAGMTSAILFQGVDVGKYSQGSNRYDIRLISDVTESPLTEEVLNALNIITQSGSEVSFDAISSLTVEETVSAINHSDRANSVTINANLTTESTTGITRRVNAYLEENPLAEGVTTKTGGMGELIGDAIGPMMSALAIGFFLVFMVMVFQFERFNQPLLVMLTVPFCVIGVALALLAAGSTLNIVSILGIISLGGTSVNNGIILIDYMNMLVKQKRKREIEEVIGSEIDEDYEMRGRLGYEKDMEILTSSIVEAAGQRLSSILMTTLTTMLGVVPMAIGTGEGSEIYAPLGQAIAGGLLATTAISLFLMPVLYFYLERHQLRKTYKNDKYKELAYEKAN